MRPVFQPPPSGPEKPVPGVEVTTTWKSCASGRMTSTNWTNEQGQSCSRSSGTAAGFCERTWRKWMFWPSISVVNWGNSLSSASALRQSKPSAQYAARALR